MFMLTSCWKVHLASGYQAWVQAIHCFPWSGLEQSGMRWSQTSVFAVAEPLLKGESVVHVFKFLHCLKNRVIALIACSLVARLQSGRQPPAVHVWASLRVL